MIPHDNGKLMIMVRLRYNCTASKTLTYQAVYTSVALGRLISWTIMKRELGLLTDSSGAVTFYVSTMSYTKVGRLLVLAQVTLPNQSNSALAKLSVPFTFNNGQDQKWRYW